MADYLSLFPSTRLHPGYRLKGRAWIAFSTPDGEPRLLHLVREGAEFDEVWARNLCGVWWFEELDRVEARNLSTQPFYRTDVGAQKTKILSNSLYRALGVNVEAIAAELTKKNAQKLLSGLVVDAFDNSVAREAVKTAALEMNLPCLHVGLAAGYAEIIWNENYRVPSAAQDDVCDYPLARNLVVMTGAVACEVIAAYVVEERRASYTITLHDFAFRRFD